MSRVLIVPAAGRGSRLGSELPKLLVPVHGRPMIDWLFARYRDRVDRFLVVVSPAGAPLAERHCAGRPERIELLVQESPTGMLDAVLIPRLRVGEIMPDEVWITWCDQVAVAEETAARLAAAMEADPRPGLAFPTLVGAEPYIHFSRDGAGSINGVLHRREGDRMPPEGEGDIGLFALTREIYLTGLPAYAAVAPRGRATGERNFLPFIPWLARQGRVCTVPATGAMEAVGINTPDELARVASHLGGNP